MQDNQAAQILASIEAHGNVDLAYTKVILHSVQINDGTRFIDVNGAVAVSGSLSA